jgi:hypothetical protein
LESRVLRMRSHGRDGATAVAGMAGCCNLYCLAMH